MAGFDNIINDLKDALDTMAMQVLRVVQAVMEGDAGINDKTGTNTLVDSDIYNELGVDHNDFNMIQLFVNDYIAYIESGTPVGTWVSVEYLIPWAIKKGIPTDNTTLWWIQNSIYEEGIRPRPIMDKAFEIIDTEYWQNWANEIVKILYTNLDTFFYE